MVSVDPGSDPARDPRAGYDYGNDTVRDPGLAAALAARIDGEVRFDEYSRNLYATDASAYEVPPIGVVYPVSTADVAAVMGYCAEHAIPVLPRGGGTSLAGQAVNEAVVLDFTRHMTEVLEVDAERGRARAQAGVTLGALNREVADEGWKFAPDPSTADRSALGGAIGNNTTGAHSLVYGKTDAYVEEAEVVLADGTVTRFGEIRLETVRERADPRGALVERIYAAVVRVVDEEADAVLDRYPALKRNVSGYNLDVLVEDAETGRVNLAKLLVGSEGTLGIVTEAEVSLERVPAAKGVGILTYRGLMDAMRDVEAILGHGPAAVEVLDGVLLDLARELDEFAETVALLPDGTDTFLLVEFYGDSEAACRERVEGLLADRVGELAFDGLAAFRADRRARFWSLRKASTPILLSRTGDEKHIAFIEDLAVPVEHLPEYTAVFQEIMADHGTFGSFYAHAGPGCMHVRPLVNVKTRAGVESMVSIADAATDLAVRLGGSVSGEHGDGRARTQWNRKLYGDRLWGVFRELKTAFDPDWLLNPGSVCGEWNMREHLRFGPAYGFDAGFEPVLGWENENGFQGMVELCHGCGGCRTSQAGTGGVMCPTYRASREEITSTRGRANLLRQAMSGDLPAGVVFSEEFVAEVLELCIGCKGCLRDCPSAVDMAKVKAELAHAYHRRHGASLRDRVFANVHTVGRVGSMTAPVSNVLAGVPGSGWVLERTLGIARERSLPRFARESFTAWYDGRERGAGGSGEWGVVVFPDTHTNYHEPDVGKAAVRVLEAAGARVMVPDGVGSSGRPAYSKGFLEQARAEAERNVRVLAPLVRDGWDVVVCEPSDAVMFQHDYRDLLDGTDVEAVAGGTYGVMEYLDVHGLDATLDARGVDGSLVYHGHCHQKATKKAHHAARVLDRAGYQVDVLDSSCCGMAGSFGYEAEHYSMSQAVGRVLFEQIRAGGPDGVVASGASCRAQIGDAFETRPAHPIETLARGLTDGSV